MKLFLRSFSFFSVFCFIGVNLILKQYLIQSDFAQHKLLIIVCQLFCWCIIMLERMFFLECSAFQVDLNRLLCLTPVFFFRAQFSN